MVPKQKRFIPKKNMKCTVYHGYLFLQPTDTVLFLNSPSIYGSGKDLLKDVRYSLLSCAKPSYFTIIFQIAIQGKNKYKIKVSKCLSTLQNVPFELFSIYVSSFAIS